MDLGPLVEELRGLPADPVSRSHPRNWLFRLRRTADIIGHARPANAETLRRLFPYPKPFKHVKFETEDGVHIAAWYGPRRSKTNPFSKYESEPDLGIVIVPGMFATKDDDSHRKRTINLWKHWNVPTVTIDMRAFGESNGIATGGWKEAYDVHAAAKWLVKEAGVSKVGVLAESMGGAATLNALAHDEETETRVMTGGALCFSAFVDVRDAVHYISSEPPVTHPFHAQWAAFRKLLSYKSHGGYTRFDDFLDDAARVNGLSGFDEMADLGNPKWKTSLIKAPTLLVHANDDPVVPVRHARRMERYAHGEPHIQVMTMPWGTHTGFESMDPWWFWEVCGRFYGHVNGVDLENPIDHR